MSLQIQEENGFRYIETDPGNKKTLLLLHGLFGALSNFMAIIDEFKGKMNVVVPILPIFEIPLLKLSVVGLVDHVKRFVKHKGFDELNVVGNSLGGHVAILFCLSYGDKVKSLTLTGSSGLFEEPLGSTFPKRGDYEFVKNKTQTTFYAPEIASKELVDEVYDIVNDRNKAIRVIAVAKSALRHNIGDNLKDLTCPVLLVWGKNDTITPAFVGEQFHERLPNSRLFILENCGHAPMMEHPEEFNKFLREFLRDIKEIS